MIEVKFVKEPNVVLGSVVLDQDHIDVIRIPPGLDKYGLIRTIKVGDFQYLAPIVFEKEEQ